MEIRIAAFTDGKGNSDEYRKFDSIDKAVEFYRRKLETHAKTVTTVTDAGTISTRRIG